MRVQDLDFGNSQLMIRNSKGNKDRVTLLSKGLHDPIRDHLGHVTALHELDLAEGYGEVCLPGALDRKLKNAGFKGPGSMCFLPPGDPGIRAAAGYVGAMCIPVQCRKR